MVVKNTISVFGDCDLSRLASAYILVKCPKPTPLVGKRTTQFLRSSLPQFHPMGGQGRERHLTKPFVDVSPTEKKDGEWEKNQHPGR